MSSKYQHQKGVIKDNALAALVHDPLFRQRVEKNKKGKGSYMRKAKHNKKLRDASGDVPAVVLNYGMFIQTVFDFAIVAFAIFCAIKLI